MDFLVPDLGESVAGARLTAWLKREGDRVRAGEPLAEVETDKTTVELEAPADGVLETIRVPAGTESLAVGTVLAVIRTSTLSTLSIPCTPCTASPLSTLGSPSTLSTMGTPSHVATPLAAKMASLARLDLAGMAPSGGGRIGKADIERALGRTSAPTPAFVEPAPRTGSNAETAKISRSNEYDDVPLTPMRRGTAARLTQAKQTIPHFYLRTDCRADALVDLRHQLKAGSGSAITVTEFLVFAVARALTKVPMANAAWTENAIRVYQSVDIAVAVNTAGGLVAPIVRRCESKSLLTLSRELKDLAERARKETLKPSDYTGGTFTISNLGMFDVTSILPIINPPHACILGVGRIEERAVVAGGRVSTGHVMSCTLAADHRVVDGATGAELLSEIRRFVENPMSLSLHG
jgi:pyruvate dehydrogenase E2 component (dihydrolipoamide acetyltransferase)